MSYTTTNRFGEVKHVYHPGKECGFVQGAWWPDFGPSSYDYSYQMKMHPTNTIFENVLEKPKNKSDLAKIDPVLAADRCYMASVHGSASFSSPAQAMPAKQFRRPLPAREALLKSTNVQPYKSGGRGHNNLGKGREGSWYEHPEIQALPDADKEAFNALVNGSLPSSSRRSTFRRSSSVSFLPEAVKSLAGTGRRTVDAGPSSPVQSCGTATLPSWVASQTLMSRASDAAGHAGAPKMQGGAKHAYGGPLSPGGPRSPSASTRLSAG